MCVADKGNGIRSRQGSTQTLASFLVYFNLIIFAHMIFIFQNSMKFFNLLVIISFCLLLSVVMHFIFYYYFDQEERGGKRTCLVAILIHIWEDKCL